jgi:molecular chaperone DnaK
MYAEAQAAQAAAGAGAEGAGAAGGSKPADDNVVDADFKEVKRDAK